MSLWVNRHIEDDGLAVGDCITDGLGNKILLKEKYVPGYNKCKVCGSKKTWHSTRLKMDVLLPNTFMEKIWSEDGYDILKKDICLKCGHMWIGQMYCWEIIPKITRAMRIKRWIKKHW